MMRAHHVWRELEETKKIGANGVSLGSNGSVSAGSRGGGEGGAEKDATRRERVRGGKRKKG